MMVVNGCGEDKKSNVSVVTPDRRSTTSKSSLGSLRSNASYNSKRPKSSSASLVWKPKNVRVRSKTAIGSDVTRLNKIELDSSKGSQTRSATPSENSFGRKLRDAETASQKSGKSAQDSEKEKTEKNPQKHSVAELKSVKSGMRGFSGHNSESSMLSSDSKSGRVRSDLRIKKQSEIPKFRPTGKPTPPVAIKPGQLTSRLPVKASWRDPDQKSDDSVKLELVRPTPKSNAIQETKEPKQVQETSKEDFSSIIPLYENEMKKITDAWVNTIYCSLTMRTNLVKLLFQAFPDISRYQFQTEDEKLLQCIAYAKNYTKAEADSLIQFVRSLLASQEKARDQYRYLKSNQEIAEIYNYDFKKLTRKITDVGEELKQLQAEIQEVQKKKDANETCQREKIRNMESALYNKDEEHKKLVAQLNVLKEKEASYRESLQVKETFKEIKADVMSLRNVSKEYEELKSKFLSQNEMYDRKIKDLETVLEEKKKALEKETYIKRHLQMFINQLQTQQKVIGREQIDYVLRKTGTSAEKRRERLWIAAVKLVLRGFLIQMKKLERDKNRLLLELQASNSENFNALATILVKKENFIKTIKNQMIDFQKVCK